MTDLVTTGHTAQPADGGPGARAAGREQALEDELERYRVELTGYCYRMLGSAFEADDAVQETMVRAWRGLDRFDGDMLRPWLYRIATNVCFTALSRRQRRPRPVDLGPASSDRWGAGGSAIPGVGGARDRHPAAAGGAGVGAGAQGLAEARDPGDDDVDAATARTQVWPVPDRLVVPTDGDPAEVAVARETIRLAFVTALQVLRPRPRAVLILRDVLRWSAREVAELLDTSVAAVNSTLQRARATLAASRDAGGPANAEPLDPGDDEQQELLARYVTAFERFDVESLVTLLHADATMDMPPNPLWLEGRLDICRFWLEEGAACQGSLLVPTVANGSPAFGVYRPSGPDGSYQPFAVQVVEVSAGRIAALRTFIDPTLHALFGLPRTPCAP